MMKVNVQQFLPFTFILLCGLFVSTCSVATTETAVSENVNVETTPEISEYDRELKSLKTADFDYIFTFKRKDGEPFTSEDKKFLKEKTSRANRRGLLKDEKVLFIGTNYKIDESNLKALKEKFEFEDFSKTEEQIKKDAAEGNSNVNAKE